MELIKKVLEQPIFHDKPPVLIDIGASGNLPEVWRLFAPYSIYIGFDADKREMATVTREANSIFKKSYIYHRVVTEGNTNKAEFYLTKNPYCSSLLMPLNGKLSEWFFAENFDVENKEILPTVGLKTIFKELGFDYVDWFKTDSQGTDLRLFKSLGNEIIDKVLVAEFEPGIIDAYYGEDKLWLLLEYMDKKNFWMSDMQVWGSQRIKRELLRNFTQRQKGLLERFLKVSPGWVEVCYFNSFGGDFSKREFLLGWVFAFLKKQYGFALELAETGYIKFREPVFQELRKHAFSVLTAYSKKLPVYFLKKALNKIKEKIAL